MASKGDVTAKLTLDESGWSAGLKKAEGDLHGFASVASGAAHRIERLLEFDIVIRGAERAFEFLKSSAESAERFSKMAQSVGMPVEALQRLGAAAKMADLSNEQLSGGLAKLAKNMQKADADSGDAARAFDALGINATDTAGNLRPTQDVFLEIADAFAGMEDGAGKTSIAMMLFGRSGAELIPLLNQGRAGISGIADAAARAGKILSAETVAGAEQFSDALKRMSGGAAALGAMITADLAGPLDGVIEKFYQGRDASETMKSAASDIAGVLRFLAGSALSAAMSIGFVGKSVMQVADMARHVAKGEFPTLDLLKKNDAELEAYVARWMGMLRELDQPREGNPANIHEDVYEKYVTGKRKAPVLSPAGKLKEEKDETKKYLDEINKMISDAQMHVDAFGQGKTAEIAWRIQKGDVGQKLADLIGAGKITGGQAGDYAERLMELTKQLEDLEQAEKNATKAQQEWDAMMKEGEQITAQLRTPAEEYAATLERLQYLASQGAITWETYARGLRKAKIDMEQAQLSKNALATDLTRGIQGIFEDFFNGGGRIDEMFANLLKRLAAKAMAQEIMLQLGFKLPGSRNEGETGLGALWSLGKSVFGGGGSGETYYGAPVSDWMAGGGDVSGGQTYLVGEEGPELFTPSMAGRITPNDQLTAGGGDVTNLHFHGTLIDGPAVEGFARQYRRHLEKGMRG